MISSFVTSQRYGGSWFHTIAALNLLVKACCSFNLVTENETAYLNPSTTADYTGGLYFGYSFSYTAQSNSLRSLSRFLVGAPDTMQRRQFSASRAVGALHECGVMISEAGNSTGTCTPIKAFQKNYHPEELYSSIRVDATGLSVNTFVPPAHNAGPLGSMVDMVCRPLHSHHCGNLPQLEGGCLLHGLTLPAASTKQNWDKLTWEERYEAANLRGKWRIINPCRTECQSYHLIDLIFVIDGSASIEQDNFDLTLMWIKNVSMGFNISGPVKIGVVQYSHWTRNRELDDQKFIRTEISLGNYIDRAKFNAAVDAIQYQQSSTYTAHAINKTVIYDFNSDAGRYPDAGRIMILLTDGKSTDVEDLPGSARFAANQGVVSYAVGVGAHYVLEELRTIAGNDRRVFEVAQFNALDEIVKGLQQSIAQTLEGSKGNDTNELIHCQAGLSSTFGEVSVIVLQSFFASWEPMLIE